MLGHSVLQTPALVFDIFQLNLLRFTSNKLQIKVDFFSFQCNTHTQQDFYETF